MASPRRSSPPTLSARLLRRIGQGLAWSGILCLLAGFGLMVSIGAASPVAPGGLVGIGLALLGLNVLIMGDITPGPDTKSFSARGQVVRGILETHAGLADLVVQAGANDRIAQMRYGPLGKPGFQVQEGVARVHLRNSFLRPNISHWSADLASNILWDLRLRSFSGNILLDLEDLRLEHIQASSVMGRIEVSLPRRGYATLDLSTQLGEVTLRIPRDLGLQITVERGPLAVVRLQSDELLSPAPNTFVTANYDTAATRAEIHIKVGAGDLRFVPAAEA